MADAVTDPWTPIAPNIACTSIESGRNATMVNTEMGTSNA